MKSGLGLGLGYSVPLFSKPFVDPTSLSGLIGWYSAHKLTGIADQGAVNSWTDFSGNANHLTPAGSFAPVYWAASNHAITPAGPQGFLAAVAGNQSSSSSAQATDSAPYRTRSITAYIVWSCNAIAGQGLWSNGGGTNKFWLQVGGTAAAPELKWNVGATLAVQGLIGGAVCQLWTTSHNDATNSGFGRLNGGVPTTYSGIALPAYVGTEVFLTGNPASKLMPRFYGEMIFYNRVLTAAEDANILAYLRTWYTIP